MRAGNLQAVTGAPSADSGLLVRVVHAVQGGDQARPGWLPVQLLLCESAGGRHIMPGEAGKPAEVCLSLLGLDADHRNHQPSARGRVLHRLPSSTHPPRRPRDRLRPAPLSRRPDDTVALRLKRAPPASDCCRRQCWPRRLSPAPRPDCFMEPTRGFGSGGESSVEGLPSHWPRSPYPR